MQSEAEIFGIAIAALGGAAVGVDRQRTYGQNEPGAIGGIRTFTLLGTVAGACGSLIANSLLPLAILFLIAAIAIVLVVRLSAGSIVRDATTEVAALAVLVSGVYAGLGHLGISAALYAWIVLLLIEKSGIHALVDRIGKVELEAAAQFAAMALIILPLLPNRTLGPHGILNLRSLWVLVLAFSGISFAGYLARKALGARTGWVVTGLIGGIVSSTQVTLSFSRDSHSYPEAHTPLFQGVMAATAVSMLRVCVLCLLLRPALAVATFAYVVAPLLIDIFFTLRGAREVSDKPATLVEKNPLRLVTALYLTLVFIGAQYLVTFARAWFGNVGMFGSGTLLGSFDIDSLLASLVPMLRQGLETAQAAKVLAFGILGNTVVKLIIALLWGRGSFRRRTALGLFATIAAQVLELIFIRL
ncbi:MAG TPA: DUF4010 domain-containing protein [Edaphobacter sp.]|nr:DUF4010 domain-containing protein [Edaphobacter sp.]